MNNGDKKDQLKDKHAEIPHISASNESTDNVDMESITLNLPMDVCKAWDGEFVKCTQLANGEWTEVSFPNHVLIGGLQYLAKLLYRIEPKVAIKRFEEELYAGSVGDEQEHIALADPNDTLPFIQGYNLCIDGAQGDGVKPYPRHKIGYTFDTLIPFRMIPESENNFETYRHLYLHHRIVELDGIRYVQYFTKKANITYRAKLDDNTDIPQHPNDNLTTDRDSRLVSEFSINLTNDELQEWFRLTKDGGAASTRFSAVVTMCGQKGKWTDPAGDGASYDTMMDSLAFSRCNIASIGLSFDGTVLFKYRMLHI